MRGPLLHMQTFELAREERNVLYESVQTVYDSEPCSEHGVNTTPVRHLPLPRKFRLAGMPRSPPG